VALEEVRRHGPFGDDRRAVHGQDAATKLALKMVGNGVMGSQLGTVDIEHWTDDPRAEEIAAAVGHLVWEAEERATVLFTKRRTALDALAARLLEVETISGEEVEAIIDRAKVEPELISG
jgi:ATP-dependent Zn protease